MSKTVINLNRFRKEKARTERRAKADENAAKFGLSKAERTLAESQQSKTDRDHDAHRIDRDEGK